MVNRIFLVVLLVLSTTAVVSAASRNMAEVIADNTQTTITGRLAVTYPTGQYPAGYYLIDGLGPIELIPSPAGVGDLYRYEGAIIEVTGNLVIQDNQRTLYVEKWVPLKARAAELPVVSGPQSTLIVLAQYSDLAGTQTTNHFQDMLTGASGSMNAYYVETSYNTITVTGTTTARWYTLLQTFAHYSVHTWDSCSNAWKYVNNFENLAQDIIDLVDPDVNFATYPHYIFVLPDVWGCRLGGYSFDTDDGVTLTHVAFVSENAGLSTFAHEFGHDLGLIDLYDYSSSDPYHFIDGWDEMSMDNAQHFTSWSKIQLGWIPPSKIATFTDSTVTQTISRIEYTTSGYHALKIKTSAMPTTFYFLVETRQKVGFDVNIPSSAPDHGVLITKIDESKGNGKGTVRLVDANPTVCSPNWPRCYYDGDAVWQIGQTYTDSDYGFSVTVNSWDGTGFSVSVSPLRISTPLSQSASQGSIATYSFSVTGASAQSVTLSLLNQPPGTTWVFYPNPVTASTSGTSVQLKITTSCSTTPGTYSNLKISGSSGSQSASSGDFGLTVSSSSSCQTQTCTLHVQSNPVGASIGYTGTFTGIKSTNFDLTSSSSFYATLTAPLSFGAASFLYWLVDGVQSPNGITNIYVQLDPSNPVRTASAVYSGAQYAVYVQSSPVQSVSMSFSCTVACDGGASSGSKTTNFWLQSSSPFSVTLTAASSAGGQSFAYWQVQGSNAGSSTTITISIPYSGSPGPVAIAIYASSGYTTTTTVVVTTITVPSLAFQTTIRTSTLTSAVTFSFTTTSTITTLVSQFAALGPNSNPVPVTPATVLASNESVWILFSALMLLGIVNKELNVILRNLLPRFRSIGRTKSVGGNANAS